MINKSIKTQQEDFNCMLISLKKAYKKHVAYVAVVKKNAIMVNDASMNLATLIFTK